MAKVDEKVVGSISLTWNPSAEIDEQSPDVEIARKDIMYIHIFTFPIFREYESKCLLSNPITVILFFLQIICLGI